MWQVHLYSEIKFWRFLDQCQIPIFSTREIIYISFILRDEVIIETGNSKEALKYKPLVNEFALFAIFKCYFYALLRDANIVYSTFLKGTPL